MTDLDQQLKDAARSGDLGGVQEALAAGANVCAMQNEALRMAAVTGHVDVVQGLIKAGADVHASRNSALRFSAENGHVAVVDALLTAGADSSAFNHQALRAASDHGYAPIVRLLRAHGDPLSVLLVSISGFTPAVQRAALCTGDLGGFSVPEIALYNTCPEVLCALLAHQGYAELAAMLSTTRMLEPLAPAARAEILDALMAQHTQPEPTYAQP